jgi:tRNA G18 (ribose-2'-O)-methylase SpoU
VSQVILSGYTPTPLDRFKQPRKDFAKVSLGAEHTVLWKQVKSLPTAVKHLKDEGYMIVAIEQDKRSTSLFKYHRLRRGPAKSGGKTPKKLALVLGNEVRGLSKSSLTLCDTILEIPMRGKKESLNVSVAAGVAVFALNR